MSDTNKTPQAPPPPPRPPAPKAQASTPRPSMRSDEKLIGRSIIGSGAPNKRR
jgi:hypothetical protein